MNQQFKGELIMRKRNDSFIVYYRCMKCSGEMSIPRQEGRKRGVGHVKDLWCPYCKADSKFSEVGIW